MIPSSSNSRDEKGYNRLQDYFSHNTIYEVSVIQSHVCPVTYEEKIHFPNETTVCTDFSLV